MQPEHVEAYPLSWPIGRKRASANGRKDANFGTKRSEGWGRTRLTVAAAISRLRQEISAFTRAGHSWVIDPATMVVSTNVPTRNDGMPYSNAREPADPGVAVYFRLRGKPHCVTCDRWNRVADNIGAIAKHLEAIRGIERWGTSDVEALFAGFKALPPGGAPIVTPQAMTAEDAAEFIARCNAPDYPRQIILNSADNFRGAYRSAALKLHPDANGGRTLESWTRLQQARDVLNRHHKL